MLATAGVLLAIAGCSNNGTSSGSEMWPLIAIPMWIVGSFLGGVFESALFLTIPVDTLVNSIEHGTEFYRYRHLVGEGSIRLMSTLDVVIGFGLPYVIGALIRRLFSGSWTRI